MKARRARRNGRAKVTLGDFRDAGTQDCANTFDVSDWDDAIRDADSDEAALAANRAELDRDQFMSAFEDALEDFGGSADEAFSAWRDGWISCARPRVQTDMKRRRDVLLDDMDMFYLSDDNDQATRRRTAMIDMGAKR